MQTNPRVAAMTRDKAYETAEAQIESARVHRWDELSLDYLKLSKLPESLGQLTQLKRLSLYQNQLKELPESLCKLTQLMHLVLSGNQLKELPAWLCRLTQLRILNLSENQLKGLPEWLGQLTQLGRLDLSNNQLKELPESLCQLTLLHKLILSTNDLTELPKWLCFLTRLEEFNISNNQLIELPESLSQLIQLRILNLSNNQLKELPESLGQLAQLLEFNISNNQLKELPESLGQLKRLRILNLSNNQLKELPESLGQLTQLLELKISNNLLKELPESLGQLTDLTNLRLDGNFLNSELMTVYRDGDAAFKRYLYSKAKDQVKLYEAKLILIGEGEVGKSCLLGALRGEGWEENRPTTHGIEIKPVKVVNPDSGTEIMLNGWDFGGQRVYRPTHQLFFSAPAVYLVVWKPREGSQQGFVKEWIKLIKNREPDAKILLVATHGGPKERQPDIDRQEIWDLFGKDVVINFFLVESKPDEKTQERKGIVDLKQAIARVAASLPEMGRKVPKRWEEARHALKGIAAAYLPLEQVLKVCQDLKMEEEEAKDFVRISHRLGQLIHYEHDPALRGIVILKPDWLSTAISFVLDDKQTRDDRGLVSFARLSQLWNDSERSEENRYPVELHPAFIRLMERFDLSYRVAEPQKAASNGTSLIAQLVPDIRPDPIPGWPADVAKGEVQQVQICRIVEKKSGQSTTAEGLFYQLIVRLHKYSLGRNNHKESVHWQRGLVLDDDYNGRALLEHIGNDVRITVRAPYPEQFLSVLTHEVKWLVESFWAGLICNVMVPCIEPCGQNAPGTGLFEVQKLIESKKHGRPEYPCPICNEWQSIDCLLRNAPAARQMPAEELLAEFASVKGDLIGIREQLSALRGEAVGRFDKLDVSAQRILSKVDDAITALMQALIDEAKDGPRLFSFYPKERSDFNPIGWTKKRFCLVLWCEHTRLPLPLLNKWVPEQGVYDFDVPRDWFLRAAPFLKVLTGTLGLVLPLAASAAKFELNEATYKGMESQLDFGKDCAEAMLKSGSKAVEYFDENENIKIEGGAGLVRAQGAILRQLHAWLKEKDPSFGGLVRVQNRRQEFLWVHPEYAKEY
jgi:Leucine-rich repeat (LRR) protein/GTPase SAR1 family protein